MKVGRTFWLWSGGMLLFTAMFLEMLALTFNMGGLWSLWTTFPLMSLGSLYVIVVPVLASEMGRDVSAPVLTETQGRNSRESILVLVGFVAALLLLWLLTGMLALQLLVMVLYLAGLGVWSWHWLFVRSYSKEVSK
ncbi:MAG TPA: hypothetical protein VGE04_19795 [Chloroflexia bacterium]|jgi:hypothetical protein